LKINKPQASKEHHDSVKSCDPIQLLH